MGRKRSNCLQTLGVGWGAEEGMTKACEKLWMKWVHVDTRQHSSDCTRYKCGLSSVTYTSVSCNQSLMSLCCNPQGRAGPQYLRRWNNIHRAVGMSGMRSFMGGRATHGASCVSICVSHVMALAPRCGTHRGMGPLAWCLSSSLPPAWSPYLFKY